MVSVPDVQPLAMKNDLRLTVPRWCCLRCLCTAAPLGRNVAGPGVTGLFLKHSQPEVAFTGLSFASSPQGMHLPIKLGETLLVAAWHRR